MNKVTCPGRGLLIAGLECVLIYKSYISLMFISEQYCPSRVSLLTLFLGGARGGTVILRFFFVCPLEIDG